MAATSLRAANNHVTHETWITTIANMFCVLKAAVE